MCGFTPVSWCSPNFQHICFKIPLSLPGRTAAEFPWSPPFPPTSYHVHISSDTPTSTSSNVIPSPVTSYPLHPFLLSMGIALFTTLWSLHFSPSPDTFPWNSGRCKISLFISTLTTIQGPNQPFQMRQIRLNPLQSGLLQAVLLMWPPLHWLNQCFTEHHHSVHNGDLEFPDACHLHSLSHPHTNLSDLRLLYC